MRVLVTAKIPVQAGNDGIADGRMPKTIEQFAEQHHPESMYFTLADGCRTMYAVVDMTDSAQMTAVAEPLFAELHAQIDMTPAMSGEDLQRGLSS